MKPMNYPRKSERRSSKSIQWRARGFALVVTLSLMILLTVIAVGLLSLSSVTLRASGQGSAEAKARSNARLALMVAIGELQKQMGPDQRISANSAIVNTGSVPNPNWTGVWDSWVAGASGTAPVNPIYPTAFGSAHQTLGSQSDPLMRPNYAQKSSHFRSWLLSMDAADAANLYAPMGTALAGKSMPQTADDAVVLVGGGSLGASGPVTDYVSARLINVKPGTNQSKNPGRYAWWVGDESQKARILEDSYRSQTTLTKAERLFRQQAPPSMGNTSITGFELMNNESEVAKVASTGTLELVAGVVSQNARRRFHDVTTKSIGVLADVREGGLKRDLSTILERPIDPAEVYANFTFVEEFKRAASYKVKTPSTPGGEEFMLYNFDSMLQSISPTGQANVPIQDLAAYYQMYNQNRPCKFDGAQVLANSQPMNIGGIQYSSTESSPPNSGLNAGIMVSTPDLGYSNNDYDKYLRQYTYQYRRPAPVKFEVVFHYITEERTQAEKDADIAAGIPEPDTHKLRIGLSPSMTFWNPYNVPLVMNDAQTFPLGPGTHAMGKQDKSSTTWTDNPVPLRLTFKKGTSSSDPAPVTSTKSLVDINGTGFPEQMFYTNGNFPMVFEPGETKVLSLQATSLTAPGAGLSSVNLQNRGGAGGTDNEHFVPELELIPGWLPDRFVRTTNAGGRNWNMGTADFKLAGVLTFKATNYISVDILAGAGDFGMTGVSTVRQNRAPYPMYNHKLFNWLPRMSANATFISNFLYMGFPRAGRGVIASTTPRPIQIPARQASQLIAAMGDASDFRDDVPQAFFYYARKAATETHESTNLSPPAGGAGRRFPARPFLHSPLANTAFFDNIDGASLYNFGWNWFFMPLNNMLEAPISISGSNSGYFGGGYTAESGTTHVVQQQLPLTPPISIAGLSSAQLGGYSIATEAPYYMGPWPFTDARSAAKEGFRRVTATGYGGLAPAGSQSIGNSYAHPNIPAGKAFTIWNRMFIEGTNTATPFADHSYLANKALWDDFFFSSITPQPNAVKVFETADRTAKDVANDFFFNDKPLPNRRITPYKSGLVATKLTAMFTPAEQQLFSGGLADKIAAYLMVNGAFNINSTSVEAWKALFSSLKGKPVAYLDKNTALTGGVNLNEAQPVGVPVGSGDVPNAASYAGSRTSPSDTEQWLGWRDLTNDEIQELAIAMVKQVKLRGPFLSLSEFVNRRLDSTNPELSAKGALQAAIDDPAIPTAKAINGGFRATKRKFTAAEKTFEGAVFPEAMEGAIAYGSSAYVDQADILRNLAEQVTPRGDTFVIRTYGDSTDASGKVVARAWCEAVVQRIPDYVDSTDAPELKQAALTSDQNKKFGRKFNIVGFRWLNSSEV